jgi:plastocyanin
MKKIIGSLTLVLVLIAGQAAPAAAPGPATASGAKTVDIDHFMFHPHTLEIAKGTKVVFTNSADVAHTATDPGAFNSGHIAPGDSFGVRFEQKGTFSYHCEIHPFTHGKIVVH